MDPVEIFSAKAEKYARYRWDYAPQAIRRIFELAGINDRSLVADIGAGTGILTRHFAVQCKLVYAVEPNGPMRLLAERTLAEQPLAARTGWRALDGRAEATGLPAHTIDLITVGQALNWFDPQPARQEFRRILKPGGWLAVIRNSGTYGPQLDEALEAVYPRETDTTAFMKGRDTPLSFYFGGEDFLQESYTFNLPQTWEQCFGSLSTASYAPDPGSKLVERFEQAARQAFDRFSKDGMVVSQVETKLYLGRVRS
jgi:ubiquinone/menaquinone biosynthesis C-methylase UbiE